MNIEERFDSLQEYNSQHFAWEVAGLGGKKGKRRVERQMLKKGIAVREVRKERIERLDRKERQEEERGRRDRESQSQDGVGGASERGERRKREVLEASS